MKARIAALFTICVGFSAYAEDPAWWYASDTGFIDPEASHSKLHNYSPANVGQLKKVAVQAKKYLDKALPNGAGTEINAMIAAWSTGGDNYAPVNLGQLKAVAKKFYTRLLAEDYNTKANLIARGYPSNWAYDTPWYTSTATSENYAPANIGQLKMAFSFDLSALDTDGDGIPNERDPDIYVPDTGPTGGTGDTDSDGLTNAEEISSGTDPYSADNPAVGLNVMVIVE